MKQLSLLLTFLFVTATATAQKAEKVKGSRVVTTSQVEIAEFENLEIEDNIEVFLTEGSKSELEIEADDNLHDVITVADNSGTLRISANKDIYGAKKFSVKITYTKDMKMIMAKDEVVVTALTDLALDDFTFKTSGSAKVFANVRAKVFTLMTGDKSKAELNISAENAMIEMSKTSQLKALITAPKLKFDMYQKAIATVEGDANDLKLRVDNNTNFTGKNLTAKNAELICEGNPNVSINVAANAIIEASGKSEVELYGEQRIEIRKFTDSAQIRKRPVK
jgi:hypothetical protein